MQNPHTLPRSEEELAHAAQEPHLFLALRADAPLSPPSRHRLDGLTHVTIGRGAGPTCQRSCSELDLAVGDRRMSGRHALLRRVLHTWIVEDRGSRNGTYVNGVRCERARLHDGDLIETGQTFFVYRELAPAQTGAPDDVAADLPPGLQTLSGPLAQQLERLRRAAVSREPVLVMGESGTGKELIAHAVHQLSRRAGELVAVNCGALPESMVEAELFGHKRGAFSGAQQNRAGLIRTADGGTLFLDEIGDLRLSSQAALLRVLQESEVLPVGAEQPIRVDLRLVSATHRDLESLVEAGSFRADLLARLRGFVLRLPALRERREDLGLILGALLRRRLGAGGCAPEISAAAARALLLHRWPQNVRELDRALGTALALCGSGPLRLEHLPAAVVAPPPPASPSPSPSPSPSAPAPAPAPEPARKDHLRAQLIRLLGEHEGNVTAVARSVGKGRTQVLRWLERYGIDAERYRA